MSAVNAFGSSTVSNTSSDVNTTDKYNELGTEDFLKLIVAELQNQDPLNPMDNTQMVTQISQIRSITSNDKLTSTLESVSMGQTIATASNMIGKTVTGTTESGEKITGTVDRVVFENGQPILYIGDKVLKPSNVTEISGFEPSNETPETEESETEEGVFVE